MVAVAVIGGALVGAGATAFSGSKAAKAQKNSANQANATQREFFDVTQENLLPYKEFGNQAMADLNNFDQAALEATPGYQFALKQGQKAIQNSASSKLLGGSGAAIKGAATFATGLADQTYGEQFNRLMQKVNVGANAAAGVGQAAQSTGQQISGNQIGVGNANAAAWNNAGSAAATAANQVGGYYMTNKLLGN